MNTQPLTRQEAFTAGMDGFEAGRGRAPALNAGFIKLACAEPDTADLLAEYLRGWDRANLDAPVPPVQDAADYQDQNDCIV